MDKQKSHGGQRISLFRSDPLQSCIGVWACPPRWQVIAIFFFWLFYVGSVFAETAGLLSIDGSDLVRSRIESVNERKVTGAEAYLRGLQTKEVSLQQAYKLALDNNPALLAQHQDREIAQHITQQNLAFFDPVVDLALAYTHNGFNERSELITRERETLVTASTVPVQGVLLPPPVDDQGQPSGVAGATGNSICVTVAGELVNPDQCALQSEIATEREIASFDARAISAWSVDAGISQRFRWGSQLQLGINTTHREKNAFPLDDLGLISALSLDDPIGRGSRFPWTSRVGATFTTPLPFGKNFGELGSIQTVTTRLAEIDEQRAEWELNNAREQVLQQVDSAYWELLRGYAQLQIVLTQLKDTQELVQRGRRLFEAQGITRYDMAQIDASLARTESREQLAWTALVSASNRLNELLDYPEYTLLLPASLSLEPVGEDSLETEAIFAAVVTDNPGLNADREEVVAAELLVQHRKIQTKPDFSLSVGINLSQSDRVLGYESVEDSLSDIFDPDTSDYFIGLNFVYPFGNHAVKSQLAQARSRQQRAQLNLQLDELAVVQTANTLITRMLSTKSQAQHAKSRLESAELTYQKGSVARDRNEISHFELLQKLDDLLSARTQYLNALIEHRKTQAQLLAVQGKLAATATGE